MYLVKRASTFVLGSIAVVGSLLPFGYTLVFIRDHDEPNWESVTGAAIMLFIAVSALIFGLRLIRNGSQICVEKDTSLMRPVLLGIGFFFPGFLFSLPITLLCSRWIWSGDGQALLGAFSISFFIAIVASIICGAVLIKKALANRQRLEAR